MRYLKAFKIFKIILLLVLLLPGCATNRGIISLQLPPGEVATANGRQIFIRSVSDQRRFEENPSRQDIPSLGFGGAGQSSTETKKRAIGRKRNSFGKAMGDILLEENQSVESLIRESLESSLAELGYELIREQQRVDAQTIVVDAGIEQFWAYMTPGAWSISLAADISTTLRLQGLGTGEAQERLIRVHSEGNYQVASEKNWLEILRESLRKYQTEVKNTFRKALP